MLPTSTDYVKWQKKKLYKVVQNQLGLQNLFVKIEIKLKMVYVT